MLRTLRPSLRSRPLSALCLSAALLGVTACNDDDDDPPGQAGNGGTAGQAGAGRGGSGAGVSGFGGSGGTGGASGSSGASGGGGAGAGGAGGSGAGGVAGAGAGGAGGVAGASGTGGVSGSAGAGASGTGGVSGSAGAAPVCGDGSIGPEETCDDANADAGDGCSADCRVETDFVCPTPGAACLSTVLCGDRRIAGLETCDDGNTASGDGCSSQCRVEAGWSCPIVGLRCQADQCGDSLVAGNERCDDGNAAPGDGCDAACQLEAGFACDQAGLPCRPTLCNDGVLEGTESCDDGNHDMGDGCSPACAIEPLCPPGGGACVSTCGDGMHFAGDPEECDDGNRRDGDGCSGGCRVEAGYQCEFGESDALAKLGLPLVLRDVKMGWNVTSGGGAQTPQPGGHPDFENNALNKGLNLGIVKDALGGDGKPQYSKAAGAGGTATTTGKPEFDQWYRDVAGVNQTVLQTMTFGKLASGAYEFDDPDFFPLDDVGGKAVGFGQQGLNHNFHFTSEVRYWFEYQGGESLSFLGDDDVWVFVNKKLVIDLGGIHGAQNGVVLLQSGDGQVTQAGVTGTKTVDLNLETGKVYEAVVWHAERHTTESRYRLTLAGFGGSTSSCESVCGDGIVTPGEACDDGTNAGGYNGCAAGCQAFGPRCGDEQVQADQGEQCDDGVNLSPYTNSAALCAPGCKKPKFCGDGSVDGLFGEQCDDGSGNGEGYGKCTTDCVLGPRCGDGLVQADQGEQCDDGNANDQDGCRNNCRLPLLRSPREARGGRLPLFGRRREARGRLPLFGKLHEARGRLPLFGKLHEARGG